MSTEISRPPDAGAAVVTPPGGLSCSNPEIEIPTLAALPVGARLVLQCRKDWRAASVAAVIDARVTLSVHSPSGHTYRVRRPADSPLRFDGPLPILGEGQWRTNFARYDSRW